MAPLKGFVTVTAVAVLFRCALAATITVGGPNGGWDQTTDLKTWAASQTFTAGDTLVFRYTPTHDVVEVTKPAYDACQASNPIRTYTGGNTAIPLLAAGKRYFICGTAGHCPGGMKLEVDVVSAASPAPPTASPAPPTASPAPPTAGPAPPTASPASPPPKSAPSPRPPKMSPSPSRAPKASAPSPASPKNSPSPSSSAPGPAASAGPSGLPPASTPASPSPSGSSPPAAPSAAGGLKASAAAGFVCGLLMLLAF